MSTRLRPAATGLLYTVAVLAWAAGAWSFCPPGTAYRLVFLGVGFVVLAVTYRSVTSGCWLTLALVPVANMPSRALALGAHEAVAFIVLACVLGWWGNQLVARRRMGAGAPFALVLTLLIITGIGSGIWTALRYADFWPLTGRMFTDAWANLAGTYASVALKRALLATATFLIVPAWFLVLCEAFAARAAGSGVWRRMLFLLACMLVPVLAIALYQNLFNPQFCLLTENAWSEARRISGGFSDPNALGVFLCLFTPLVVLGAWRERGLRQMLLIAIAGLCLYVITLSGSRSAVLQLGLTALLLGVLLVVRQGRAGGRRAYGTAGAALAALLVLLCLPLLPLEQLPPELQDNPVVERLSALREQARLAPGRQLFGQRELQWRQAVSMWRDYPLAGIGMGAFSTEVGNYNRDAPAETPIDNAWNQYLQWFTELGAAGLLFWVWFYLIYAERVLSGLRARAPGSVDTLFLCVLFSSLAAFHLALVFGAHLQAAEVACLYTAMLALGFAYTGAAAPPVPAAPGSRLPLVLALALILAAQGENALGPLSRSALQQQYQLPAECGFYQVEPWQSLFKFQWTERTASRRISVPAEERVLVLKLMAGDPDITPLTPKLVRVYVDGRCIATLRITARVWAEQEIYLYDCPTGPAVLTLVCDRTWRAPDDPRDLGVAVATGMRWQRLTNARALGLSPFYADVAGAVTTRYAWTEQCAACKLAIGNNCRMIIGVRAPVRVPFYRARLTVDLLLNGRLLKKIVLPRRSLAWVWEFFTVDDALRGQEAMVGIRASRLSALPQQEVGVALAEIATD